MTVTIRTDKRGYSRSMSGYDQIAVSVTDLPTNSPITIALVRLDGYGDVIAESVTPSSLRASATLDLIAPSTDGISYIRRGSYRVEARNQAGAILASTPTLAISPIPVEVFRETYLFGIQLYAEQMLLPVVQPTIPGVQIAYVDPGMYKGPGDLVFDATDRTITWRGGPAAEVSTGDDPYTIQVLTPQEDAYLELEIDPYLLPTDDATNSLLIDNWRMRPSQIRQYLDDAYDWVEQKLQLRLETTIVTTDPGASFYDVAAEPQDYIQGEDRTLMILNARARPLQRVLALGGWYAGQQAVAIPSQWITIEGKGAQISLVPVTGTGITVSSTWSAWNANLRAQRFIANYWHYTAISGLCDLRDERAGIREAIATKAALKILQDLSLAATGGRTSRSASREGVSESWNYSNGAYGEKIQAYSQWLDVQMPKLRQRHAGLVGVTL